jgi:hypothetical protein
MDFLFHVPFFCTAAGAVAEIRTVFSRERSSTGSNDCFVVVVVVVVVLVLVLVVFFRL